jgi:mono/diheme cytochrome c family protein
VAVLSASVLAAAGACAADAPPATGPARLSFNRDIRPILSDNCFACHGPDHANRQAGLRLDVAEQAVAELDSGTRAIVPGDAEASELVARIVSTDPDTVMPPPEAKIGRLTDEQVDLLKRWIAQGAPYEPHWAFVPVARPDVPEPAGPAGESQALHPIDRIVRAKLEKRGINLQPEADMATLIRRATFDITGLPPTPEEIEAFPHKNVIVRALGMKESVVVDINRVEPKDGDIFLLCSDGLSGMVTDQEMEKILQMQPNLEKACAQLIDAANANGGNDNVTCVLAQYRRG